MKRNSYKPGDEVRYIDGDPRTFIVYAIYSPTTLSLGLAEWPDTEQDILTNIKEIEPAECQHLDFTDTNPDGGGKCNDCGAEV